jgi:hypothetical protein
MKRTPKEKKQSGKASPLEKDVLVNGLGPSQATGIK